METKYNQIHYNIAEVTPFEMRCGVGMCPGIYEGIKIVSPENECGLGACPAVYETSDEATGVYLVIGKLIDPKLAGLEKKIGDGETLIEIPRNLIDSMNRK